MATATTTTATAAAITTTTIEICYNNNTGAYVIICASSAELTGEVNRGAAQLKVEVEQSSERERRGERKKRGVQGAAAAVAALAVDGICLIFAAVVVFINEFLCAMSGDSGQSGRQHLLLLIRQQQ